MENFSKNLKEVRMQKGLSQKQMAELLGVSYRTYQNYELLDSNNREPDLEMLCKISGVLNVSVDYLLDIAEY
ncbi:MAG: helix-turn-helix transcriptional regulator [Clostridiales bacterium]|nr:helix-turn-helix transcriptional regulator [Clostridiales bacterium]